MIPQIAKMLELAANVAKSAHDADAKLLRKDSMGFEARLSIIRLLQGRCGVHHSQIPSAVSPC